MLDRVIADCLQSYARADVTYEISVDPALDMRPELAIPTSLIVYEAVANAIEHGFPDGGGSLAVDAGYEGDWIVVCVADNGQGLPADFAIQQDRNMGLKLSSALAGQCGGAFDLKCREGKTRATLRLPRHKGA